MKFYSSANKTIFRLGVVIAFSITISGCAMFKKYFAFFDSVPEQVEVNQPSAQEQQRQVSQELSAPAKGLDGVEVEVEVKPELTPEQIRIAELKAKPNLYFAGSPFPPEAATVVFQQALEAKRQRDFKRAENLFSQITQDFPSLSGPYMQLGDLVLRRHNTNANPTEEQIQVALTSAANYYQQAIKVNQHNYFAQNRLAKVRRLQGQFELAESHYQQAIDSWPAFDTAYLNLGILYDLYLGKKVLALRQYETYQALQSRPGRQVNGWIADLQRQIARAKTNE